MPRKLSTDSKADSASLESSDLPTEGRSPGEVEVVSDTLFDAGAGAPSLGMSPAEIEHAKAQMSAVAIRSRFMEVSPWVLVMQDFLHRKE